jgi:hypothetical protein
VDRQIAKILLAVYVIMQDTRNKKGKKNYTNPNDDVGNELNYAFIQALTMYLINYNGCHCATLAKYVLVA